ncbi:Alpha/Beta hydrolase protein [Mariannaea sp. PMI_226]|nr:Alpha/Beta hydrolase protein [Mariannaea sp. PMI_226]
MQLKSKPEHWDVDPNFVPLPKYGHLSEINPQFAVVQEAIDKAFDPIWAAPDWVTLRKFAPATDAEIPPGGPDRTRDIVTELLYFPARDGHIIELKVYKSPNVTSDATLMYKMHGGGFCLGNHETDGAENVHAAARHNIVVVSVDYRLAPEHPFPQANFDCFDGLLWCKDNAQVLGINPEKIILAGSSAGGNLAASLALEARENGVTGIVAQVLHFAGLCHPKFFPKNKYEFGSFIQNVDASVLSGARLELLLDAYIPNLTADQRHSPLLAESHKGLPPALIQCAGLDVMRDAGLAYAEALKNANIEVDVFAYQGLPHCFPGYLHTIPETSAFYKRYNAFLSKYY